MRGELFQIYSDPLFFKVAIYSNVIALLAFIGFAAPLTWISYRNPQWIRKYRIQSSLPNQRQLAFAIRYFILNTGTLFGALIIGWPLLRLAGIHDGPGPTLVGLITSVGFFLLLEDLSFYLIHRALHASPFLYKHIHSVHHQLPTTFALAGYCLHPLEMIALTASFLLGPALLQTHVYSLWAWVIVRQWITASHHCGLDLPFYRGVIHHDFHHSKFIGNYAATFSFWDRLFETTSKNFKSYLVKKDTQLTAIELNTVNLHNEADKTGRARAERQSNLLFEE